MSSPSGAPVTTYCILAVAPGRTGWSSASLRPSSNHSWDRYFAIGLTSVSREKRRRSLPSGTTDRRAPRSHLPHTPPEPCEQVVLIGAFGGGAVDQRPGQEVLLPGEDLPYDLLREAHPEPRRVDLGAVRQQRRPALVE